MYTRSSARLSQKQRYRSPTNNTFNDEYEDESNIKTRITTPRKKKNTAVTGNSTPPKQKKNDTLNEVTTPEGLNRKQLIDSQTNTPSSLLQRLELNSPPKSAKKLFKDEKQSNFFNTKAKNEQKIVGDIHSMVVKDSAKRCLSNAYQTARKALQSTVPVNLPGREKEISELKDFINTHLSEKISASMYVSGPPGTGKSASLTLILQEECLQDFKHIYINCTSIKSPTAVYSRIFKELDIKSTAKTEKEYLSAIEKYMKKSTKMIILVLDEIDQLESKNHSILYTIFEWPAKAQSCLILIGIANALDLTDRILPRLQARCELKPNLMHFAPYTKQQIMDIFTSRLKENGVDGVFSAVALQMLAGKVASVSGDVRRALDIGRRVVELADQSSKDILKSVENLETEKKELLKQVELKDVLAVVNNVYGGSQNLQEDSSDECFPLQQKIIVCSLLLMLNKAKNKDVTLGRLHEVYRRVCSKRNLIAVDQAEFVGLCSLIETRGMIKVAGKGKMDQRMSRVGLQWNEEEVAAALRDKQLMSQILQDVECLGKM
ncbi:unnamed protein product [Acanthoscelides obtectus]|uniref:Cell division control protein n=1 Tax=Acanthoscelides obtectus TaxID=200917 RepID=A0A9P0L3I4_ACAOB|nr:unnamed protein product [Acanthoscelides obtectus]CAK1678000.1 Cell division control protein 6 homolog [Acanthoscelides obtectus]